MASERDDKAFLKVLKGEAVTPRPIWLMRQAGRYLPEYKETRAKAGSFLDLCYTPDYATEVTLQPIRRFGFDASILFADILLVPHALGQPLTFQEGEGPLLEPITERAGIAELRPDEILTKLQPVFQTVENLSRELPSETALIGFAGAPWTVATYMVAGRGTPDQAPAKQWALKDPEGFQLLIDLLVETTATYLDAQIRAGAEAVQLFDTWALGLPEPMLKRWCLEPTRAIAAKLKQNHPDVPVIAFARGAGLLNGLYADLAEIDALGLDSGAVLGWAAETLMPKKAVQGNLDPQILIAGGDALDAEIDRILAAFEGGPHVFNLGHGILPHTPIAHVERLVERVRGAA